MRADQCGTSMPAAARLNGTKDTSSELVGRSTGALTGGFDQGRVTA
jgi:hypothetical protein